MLRICRIVYRLAPDTEVFYTVSNYYSAEHDKGLLWNDPDVSITLPIPEGEAILSDKDRKQPRIAEIVSPSE